MKNTFFLMIALVATLNVYTQYSPKKIKSQADYIQKSTNLIFPLQIDNYKRTEIFAFNNMKTNLGVSYEHNKTDLTIYVYPAGNGTEDRFRNEYLNSLQVIANRLNSDIEATQFPISFKDSGYKVNGFKAEYRDFNEISSLSVYECGQWFFKIRITTENLDSIGISNLETRILDLFVPTKLVQRSPLNPRANILISPDGFADKVMLGSTLARAYNKIAWVNENIDSLERIAGFPSLYLEMHVSSLLAFVNFEKDNPDLNKTKETADYLFLLNSIISNGFIDEFILDQYNMVMIIPKDLELNIEAYQKWKNEHNINIDLNNKLYSIQYKK
jgi:hypothetical protein